MSPLLQTLWQRVFGDGQPVLTGEAGGIEARILSALLYERPFPYVIADDVLPRSILESIRQHWPERSSFEVEVPGNDVCNPRELDDDGTTRPVFWHGFARDVAPVLARACLGKFAEWVIARYAEEFQQVVVGNFSLMQSDPTYPGHPCHAHHWHDPLWIATLLLYLDEDPGGQQGTTLNTFVVPPGGDPLEYASAFSAQKPTSSPWHGATWDPSKDTVEVCTAEYKANRMIAFLDSPISYHSVKPVRPGAYGARRLLRMHLGAPWTYSESLYGLSYQEYRDRRKLPIDDDEAIAWLRRDISQIWATSQSMSEPDRRTWAHRLSFDFVGGNQ